MTDDPNQVGSVSVTSGDDGVLVQLTGEIDISNVDSFRHEILTALDPPRDVVFDLAGVEFMDTSGLALLIDIANSAPSCVLRAPSTQVRRVIEASGLTSVLRVMP